MITVTVTGIEQAKAALQRHPEQLKAAEQRAVAKAVAKVRLNTIRLISATSSIAPAKLQSGLTFHQANPAIPDIVFSASGKAIGAEYYGAKKVGNGMAWMEAGVLMMVPHAFINAKLGNRVWIRKPGGGPTGLVGRLPIKRVFGSSIAGLFIKYQTTIVADAQITLRAQLLQELEAEFV